MTDAKTTTTANGASHALTKEEGAQFLRVFLRLLEMTAEEAECISYLCDLRLHRICEVTRYTDLLDERIGIIERMAERYGKRTDPGTPPANLTEATADLLEYFAERDRVMFDLINRLYGIPADMKCFAGFGDPKNLKR